MSKARLAEKLETPKADEAPVTTAPVVELKPAAKPAIPRIHPSRFHINDNAHNTWAAHPERGVTFDEMLEPSFWGHISESKLRPGDTIIVYPADNTYRAALAVRASGRLFAQVAVLWKTDFPELKLDTATKFTTLYADPQTKWAVIRIADNKVMQGNFDTQEAAMQWLGINARTLAA
jgi:hypothetical protein